MKSVKSFKYIKVMKKTIAVFTSVIILCLSPLSEIGGDDAFLTVTAAETQEIKTGEGENVFALYQEYRKCLDSIEYRTDISENGYEIVEDQVFPIEIYGYGEEEVFLIPAFDEKYNRLALFLAEADGKIIYKTDQLETNNRVLGQMKQPKSNIAAIGFRDLDKDGRM
ncbi:MAG: hypothetical protein K2N85_16475, partial [Lachnospiraceae bacterium]|nr:hypothetical protein [Lachnospiraceae bacterium]